MSIEGVRKYSQPAVIASLVPIGVGGQCGTYTAPVIPGSDLPPLLGLKSLERKFAILDMVAASYISLDQVACTFT